MSSMHGFVIDNLSPSKSTHENFNNVAIGDVEYELETTKENSERNEIQSEVKPSKYQFRLPIEERITRVLDYFVRLKGL